MSYLNTITGMARQALKDMGTRAKLGYYAWCLEGNPDNEAVLKKAATLIKGLPASQKGDANFKIYGAIQTGKLLQANDACDVLMVVAVAFAARAAASRMRQNFGAYNR